MPLTAYLKVDGIAGESRRAGHEHEIDIHDIRWNIEHGAPVRAGRGRSRARARVDAFQLSKFTDASSVYLAQACLQGKSFAKVTLAVRKESGDAHLDYLTITMTDVIISKYEVLGSGQGEGGMLEEGLALVFEDVTYKYVVQEDDHSAGDEHEITYDIAAGA